MFETILIIRSKLLFGSVLSKIFYLVFKFSNKYIQVELLFPLENIEIKVLMT